MFTHYANHPRAALNLIDRHLRNAFVVYVADRARNTFSEGNLWGNFFNGFIGFDTNIQSTFKQIFVDHIERRGMPLYGRDEETNYYFYTALLHGGLSADSWASLWDRSLLPLARGIAKGDYGFCGEMDGHSILRELKNPESRFAPRKSVANILGKAPDSTIAPLFEAAMRVAAQEVERHESIKSRYTMLSNFGLPEIAMEALCKCQDNISSPTEKHRHHSSYKNQGSKRRLIYLPMASLQLSLAEGVVFMRWPRRQFPLDFAGARIDYYIDGNLMQSSSFDASVGKCVLEATSIAVNPQARYDVELRLMRKNDITGEFEESGTLRQTFTRSKPCCFEFIKDSKGIYRLRGRNERISKKRRIAYIVKEGYKLAPGQGMTAISEHETTGEWNDTQVFVYDVEPGSSGSIISLPTGEEVAIWQERYVAKIDRRRIIGETSNGTDLYGYAPSEIGTNSALPSITIEAIDGLSALEDLDIACICDGQRISMPRRVSQMDNSAELGPARVVLDPQKSSLFNRHIEECIIEAKQRPTGGKTVFRCKFSAIPIQDFRPTEINLDFGIAVATYTFQAVLAIDVEDAQGRTDSINAWDRYIAKTLLKDEFLHIRIYSRESAKKTEAKLALAAIDIQIPDELAHVSKIHAICLADALSLGPSAANFKIVSKGWRYNRAAMVMLDMEPIFYKELKQPGVHTFNLFGHIDSFRQSSNSSPSSLPLKLSLAYGDDVTQGYRKPAWLDASLLDCVQGVGILDWRLLVTSTGEHLLRFEGKASCDVNFQFKKKVGRRPIAEAIALTGATELALPECVVRLLDMQKTIIVEVSPCDWFGNPQREYATEFALKR